jgi:hypothetical protein
MKAKVAMSLQEIEAVLATTHGESAKGACDGSRVHVHYKAFGEPTEAAILAAKRAKELGLPRNRYTGRVVSLWNSGAGDKCMTLFVELERDHQFRTLNFAKGEVFKFVVLGD